MKEGYNKRIRKKIYRNDCALVNWFRTVYWIGDRLSKNDTHANRLAALKECKDRLKNTNNRYFKATRLHECIDAMRMITYSK